MIKELEMAEESSLLEVISRVRIEFNQLIDKCNKMRIQFVSGKGSHKTREQRYYEHYQNVKEKFETYRKHLEIMG